MVMMMVVRIMMMMTMVMKTYIMHGHPINDIKNYEVTQYAYILQQASIVKNRNQKFKNITKGKNLTTWEVSYFCSVVTQMAGSLILF